MPLRLQDLVRPVQALRAGDAGPALDLADHVLAVPEGIRQLGHAHPGGLPADSEQAAHRLHHRLDLVARLDVPARLVDTLVHGSSSGAYVHSYSYNAETAETAETKAGTVTVRAGVVTHPRKQIPPR